MNDWPKARARFPHTHQPLLTDLARVIEALRKNTHAPSEFPTANDALNFYNRYIEFAIALFLTKFCQLYEAVASSIEEEQYLVYAAAGRAIIENAATLRYYSFHADLVALHTAWVGKQMNDEMLQLGIKALDKLVRGNRFTWNAFIEQRFAELGSSPDGTMPTQINVATCLDKWYKDDQRLQGLYALFCDLVHPNIGSNLLVLRIRSGRLLAGGRQGQHDADLIVFPTLAGLIGVYKEIQAAGLRLEALGLTRQN